MIALHFAVPILQLGCMVVGLGLILLAVIMAAYCSIRSSREATWSIVTCRALCWIIAINGYLLVCGLQFGGKRLDRLSAYAYIESHTSGGFIMK